MTYKNISFEELRPHLLHQFSGESQLLKAVGEVGKLFNFYRENIDQYREDEKLVSAYCAYYLTTNYPKLFQSLELLGEGFDISSFDRIVDIGTGPGTFLLALSDLASESAALQGVDISPVMLSQAKRILEGLRPERKIELASSVTSLKDTKGKTLAIFTHSLNEMGPKKAAEYIEKISPDAILVLEPGTKESFAKALDFRTWCIGREFNVAYPCFSNSACPLDLEKDWCHQYIEATHSDDVERMTQKLQRNRRLLPMVIQLFDKGERKKEKEKEKETESSARLVRVKKPTKHSLEWQLCESREGQNFAFDAEVPKRGMSKKEIKSKEDILAGISVEYALEKEMSDKSRIKLLSES